MSKEVTIGCRLTADIRRDVILQRARLPRVRGTDTNICVGVYDTILERETSRITSYKGGNKRHQENEISVTINTTAIANDTAMIWQQYNHAMVTTIKQHDELNIRALPIIIWPITVFKIPWACYSSKGDITADKTDFVRGNTRQWPATLRCNWLHTQR
mmetsp:Transcript_23606/g.28827  ORF Transcript_23606/g.28827 Transcript_23606/m.28827 type:complete len:158 (+) Transcript_23606:38-511(+)